MKYSALASRFNSRLSALLVLALLLPCSPTLFGGAADHSPRTGGEDPPEDHPTSVLIAGERWMEAECAYGGEEWQRKPTDAGSNQFFLHFPGNHEPLRPKEFGGPAQLTFTVDLSVTAAYTLYFRLNSPRQNRRSLWVSIDDGPWVKFSKQRNQQRLTTQGFEWREVVDNGEPLDLHLKEGEHTIRVAARESGTQLDKVFLSPSKRHPASIRVDNSTCAEQSTSTFRSIDNSFEEPERLIVYPELSGNTLRVLFPAATFVPFLIQHVFITGSDGREYPIRRIGPVFWVWGGASNELLLNIGRLPPGVYTFHVGERNGRQPIEATFVR